MQTKTGRRMLGLTVAALSAATMLTTATTASYAQSVDLSKWSPEYVKSIAGTKQFDAAKDCGAVVPNDYAGKVSYWYTGPFEADPQIAHDQDKAFWEAFHAAYPNIETDVQSITYNELLDKFRTALLGNAAPAVVRLQILGGVEFAAKGYLQPITPEFAGYKTEDEFITEVRSDLTRTQLTSVLTSPPVTQVVLKGTRSLPNPSIVAVAPGTAQALGKELAAARGWGDGEFACLLQLWNEESGWRVNAQNAYSGAYGIPQALPGSKMATVGADWQTNPATQITWGLNYIAARYGTPCGAYSHWASAGYY